jgi:hypothetical protein
VLAAAVILLLHGVWGSDANRASRPCTRCFGGTLPRNGWAALLDMPDGLHRKARAICRAACAASAAARSGPQARSVQPAVPRNPRQGVAQLVNTRCWERTRAGQHALLASCATPCRTASRWERARAASATSRTVGFGRGRLSFDQAVRVSAPAGSPLRVSSESWFNHLTPPSELRLLGRVWRRGAARPPSRGGPGGEGRGT